jgi:hypothetical protein
MSEELSIYDKLHLHLFEGKGIAELYLSADELEVKKRIETVFTKLLDQPDISEHQLRTLLKMEFNVSIATAYRDLMLVKSLFGNFKKTSREYYRHRVIGMIEAAYEKAKTKEDFAAMILAADKLGKYTRLDQPDTEEVPWDELIPPSFEPTNDIEVLGFKRDPNIQKKKQQLFKRFFSPEDATIIK